jgi:hypothetical protein
VLFLFRFFAFLLFCFFTYCANSLFIVLNESRHVDIYFLLRLLKLRRHLKDFSSFPSVLSLQAFGAVASSVTSLHIPKVFISKIGEDGESLILMADTDRETKCIVWLAMERQNPFSEV